jgi:6-phosphogluconolactonase
MSTAIDTVVAADSCSALQAAAELLRDAARAAVTAAGAASLALSGGATPRGMHRMLVQPPYVAAIPWNRLHLFWVDERLVSYENPASNYGAARADFIESLPQSPASIHPVPVHGDGEAMALLYAEEIAGHFRQRNLAEPVFDVVFLGLGADGHTASLFPASPALAEQRRWAAAVKGGDPDVERVTLTCAVLNRARRVVFLVTGESKAAVVRHVLTEASPLLPAQRIRPPAGRITWVLDRAAAALLGNSGVRV